MSPLNIRMTSAVRKAHLALADDRAMEEQMERENPVNPKNTLNNRRETAMRNIGSGATPSMGLSQVRGGSHSESDEEHDEAREMGHALGRHLYGLHGGVFHRSFSKGITMAGGRREVDAQPPMAKSGLSVAQMRQQHNKNFNADYEKNHPILSKVGEYGMKAVKGLSNAIVEHGDKVGVPKGVRDVIEASQKVANGRGKTGAYEGKGMVGGKKRRAPAGASDGRRKRADIVKKVMAEKGMKMIEASKYVKEHGLY